MKEKGYTRRSAPAGSVSAPDDETRLLRQNMNDKKFRLIRGENRVEAKGSSGRRVNGMIDRALQAQLGRQLRAIFADVSEEPVPDRFIKLLKDLEAREKQR
jgi:hypothetical protein